MSGLTRTQFEALWARLDAEADACKFSHQALLRMQALYESLDAEDRAVVDEVLSEWIVRGDPRRRFDAEALVNHFRIGAALPALRLALDALREAHGPSVPYDRAKIERIIARIDLPPPAEET